MSFSVLIPYRSDNAERDRIFDWVLKRWQIMYPNAQICIGTDNSELFSRSAARNHAYRQARCDMLVIADADTPPTEAVGKAVEKCATSGMWYLPYGAVDYYNLAQEYSNFILSQDPLYKISPKDENFKFEHKLESWAGILILPRKAFETVGGYDTRFVGWGYEDNVFQLALDTLWGGHKRMDRDSLFHIWHPITPGTNFDSPTIIQNQNMWLRYKRAYGKPMSMQNVVRNNL